MITFATVLLYMGIKASDAFRIVKNVFGDRVYSAGVQFTTVVQNHY
jgi:hypothetical protein